MSIKELPMAVAAKVGKKLFTTGTRWVKVCICDNRAYIQDEEKDVGGFDTKDIRFDWKEDVTYCKPGDKLKMQKKRFYFDVGDTDDGRISLVRGFFYGFLKNQELLGFSGEGFSDMITCPTLENTHSCAMAAHHEVPAKDRRMRKYGGTDRVYTDPDNTEGKEAFIEFEVYPKGEATYTKMIELCNELLKLDE